MQRKPRNDTRIVPENQVMNLENIKEENWRNFTLYDEFREIENVIQWAIKRRLIFNSISCDYCNRNCSLCARNTLSDKYEWRCSNCDFRRSIGYGLIRN